MVDTAGSDLLAVREGVERLVTSARSSRGVVLTRHAALLLFLATQPIMVAEHSGEPDRSQWPQRDDRVMRRGYGVMKPATHVGSVPILNTGQVHSDHGWVYILLESNDIGVFNGLTSNMKGGQW